MWSPQKNLVAFLAILLVLLNGTTRAHAATPLTNYEQSLFNYSMLVQDTRFDPYYKYIWYQDSGEWSSRFSIWYSAGLFHRNQDDDVENGRAVIRAVLACQMNGNRSSAWYGTYRYAPDAPEPTPDSGLYAPSIYDTYDPNWREFIGIQLVQLVEEFEPLIGPHLVQDIETALAIGAVGEMRRNGTYPPDDNLILAYSNPNYMRALTIGWIGYRLQNSTFIDFADQLGTELLQLFKSNGSNTLGEYNAPTYYGMDMFALGSHLKYGPPNATMTVAAPYIISQVWEDIADHYNGYLGNLAGPYDRAYTRDLTVHSAVISYFWWGMFGRETSPVPELGDADVLFDVAQGAAISLVTAEVLKNIPTETRTRLMTRDFTGGERLINRTIRESLTTDRTRHATSWLTKSLMIGGETLDETVNRGEQFVPAIVHWASDPDHKPFPYNGFFSLYPSASAITTEVGNGSLTVSYPNTTQTDLFTFAISGMPPHWILANNLVNGFRFLPCLEVTVNATGLQELPTVYGSILEDHYFYNVSYLIPADFSGIPSISFNLEYIC